MRALIYKMTHLGDPHERVWGESDCMGEIRDRPFSAVIGLGAKSSVLYDRMVWAAIGPIEIGRTDRGRILAFEHFLSRSVYNFTESFPNLAGMAYDNPSYARAPIDHWPGKFNHPELDLEITIILRVIMKAPPSTRTSPTIKDC